MMNIPDIVIRYFLAKKEENRMISSPGKLGQAMKFDRKKRKKVKPKTMRKNHCKIRNLKTQNFITTF